MSDDEEIENQLKRIENKLERGSLNHLKRVNEKAKRVKNTNQVVDEANHQYKLKIREKEEENLHFYVKRYYDKHKNVKKVKEELKMHKNVRSKSLITIII